MLSLESEVLSRHLPQLQHRSILLFGHVRDQFADTLSTQGSQVSVFSNYYDVARHQRNVEFGLLCTQSAELAIYYWTKNKQECQFQLLQWLSRATPGQKLWIVGENRTGIRSVEALLANYGDIAKTDSARRCSLYQFQLTQRPDFDIARFWKHYRVEALPIFALPAVFSSAELDGGTQLLLSTFQQPKLSGKVLDLGCGAGVIGAYLKQRCPTITLTLSDIHAMALASAERTLAENGLSGDVVASDVFSDIQGRFDLIVSNPPFHDGVDTAYRAVEALIAQAKQHLVRNGELRLVANAFLPYPDLLDRAFGHHQVLAKSTKFKVYSARA